MDTKKTRRTKDDLGRGGVLDSAMLTKDCKFWKTFKNDNQIPGQLKIFRQDSWETAMAPSLVWPFQESSFKVPSPGYGP